MAEDERDFFHLNRLKAFNDAVFSIVATILILPLRKIEEEEGKGPDLDHYLLEKWPHILVYLFGFLIVCAVWESHVNRFKILSHVDDVLVWLNLISLMFTSFLPFSTALEGVYSTKMLPIILNCANLFILEVLEMVMVMYCFSNVDLLTEELQELPEVHRKEKRDYMMLRKVVNPMLFVMAACVSMINVQISWVLMAVVVITPCINRFLGFLFRKIMNIRIMRSDFDKMFGNYIDTERVECFSDGVFAIVSTLLVLDISSEEFPKAEDVEKDGLDLTVLHMWPKFLTYVGTFFVVALLWFVHHSVFHYIRNMNQIMLVFNNISLAFIGAAPMITVVLNRYGTEVNDNVKVAIRFSSVIVCIAGIAQALVFITALLTGPTHLEGRANPATAPASHNYVAAKLLVIPVISCLVYYVTFSSNTASFVVFYVAVLATPLLFVLLKICCGRSTSNPIRHEIVIDPDTETWIPQRPKPRRARRSKGPMSTIAFKTRLGQ